MPNRLKSSETAIILVHPWEIDDENSGSPEPAGCADFCTPRKNHLAAGQKVIDPFLKSLRSKSLS
ncbi:MAG: hypothetical protein U0872_06310 [Planctomycetaceae bacterium]